MTATSLDQLFSDYAGAMPGASGLLVRHGAVRVAAFVKVEKARTDCSLRSGATETTISSLRISRLAALACTHIPGETLRIGHPQRVMDEVVGSQAESSMGQREWVGGQHVLVYLIEIPLSSRANRCWVAPPRCFIMMQYTAFL
jgi:hypothetical protein